MGDLHGNLVYMASDRVLRLAEVLKVTGLSRTSLYRALAEQRFPRPVKLGKRSRGWRNSEVQAWIQELESEESWPRDEAKAPSAAGSGGS